jgi:hypothetical protein
VQWDYSIVSPARSGDTIIDGTLTSNNFNTILPYEIGIGGFFDSNGSNDMYFDDFSLNTSSNGEYEQYY